MFSATFLSVLYLSFRVFLVIILFQLFQPVVNTYVDRMKLENAIISQEVNAYVRN